MDILFLLLLGLALPVLPVLLFARFWKLSFVQPLPGRARTLRLRGLVGLAAGILLLLYLLVRVYAAPLGSAHGAGRSAWPWGQEHPATSVLLAGVAATLVLVRKPAQRLAGGSFGAGVLLVGGGLGVHWYFTGHQEDLLGNLRQADSAYREFGGPQATLDSFKLRAPTCVWAQALDQTAPPFPGYPGAHEGARTQLARLRLRGTHPVPDSTLSVREVIYATLRARIRPQAPRPPLDAYVEVRCIVDTTGRVILPYVTRGLGQGYNEEAVRVVRSLSPLSPGTSRGVLVPAIWDVAVPFAR